jgi:serine/threonine protein kinase
MGHVFMALTGQAGVERVCALKVLKEVRAGRDAEELTQRFLDEAKVVTKLSHETLVYVFDFGIHERQGYLAMEYVQGKSITETWNRCAARRDGFPIGLTLYYIGELVSALWYAANVEGLGLVHRDISPSNVMLTYTGGVKLIDFGLAKWKAKVVQTATGVQWGKTSYMSPEQYTGKPVDHRSDLFSAGVILWELLTGRQLFPPSETRATTAAVPPPSRHTRDVAPGLDGVVARALAINPAERFQTGEEMCAALMEQMPSEASGKLQAAKFIGRLFETEIRDEAAEQRDLIDRAARMDDLPLIGEPEKKVIEEPINEGATTPDPDPDGLLGKTLSDRYYVRRLVGEGAMGRVYEGHHTGIGKRVAIKIAHKVERRKSEIAKRFQREALAPAQIGHPNVADVTDCGTTEAGEFFFVMEFIDGVSLDTVIRRNGQIGIERALAIGTQICRALDAAHRAGIIHRDLKPSNVMLVRSQDQEELVKVLDFGVAKFLHDTGDTANLTLTGATVGTPKYMAPEQIRGGGKVDFRSDIYSLGAILYTMLAGGRLPIEGATVDEIWQHKLTRDPRPLHDHRSDLPGDLEELILRCLARDPAERPQSAEDLKKQLVAHLESIRAMGDSILGMKSPSQTEVLGERMRRRRARFGIALGALTAVSIAGLGMFFIGRPAPRQRGNETAKLISTQPIAVNPTPVAEPAPQPEPVVVPTPAAKLAPPTRRALPPAARAPTVPASAPKPATASAPTGPPKGATKRAKGGDAVAAAKEPPAPPPTPEPAASPEEAMAAIKKAEAAFSDNHLATARVEATQAVAASKGMPIPVQVRALVIMGKVQLASEQLVEAQSTFSRALALDPGNALARKGLQRAQESATKEEP